MSEIAAREAFDEVEIAIQEIELRQGVQISPADLLEDSGFRLASEFRDCKKEQVHTAATRVFVLVARELGAYDCLDLQFFRKLTHERLLGGFAVLDLPARKLPLVSVPVALAPLANQHAAIAANDARGNEQGCTVSHQEFKGFVDGQHGTQ